jgi:hypothetical protein
MTEEQALKFVEAAKLPLSDSNKLARCVDGRYENMPDMPLAAKPGGDAGDLMALFAALNMLGQSLPNEEVVKIMARLEKIRKGRLIPGRTRLRSLSPISAQRPVIPTEIQ